MPEHVIAMVDFPDFTNSFLVHLVVCTRAETTGTVGADFVFRVPPRSPSAYCLVASHKDKNREYLHVEIATPSQFAKGKGPTATGKRSAFDAIVESMKGQKVDCVITGKFRIPSHRLPDNGIVRKDLWTAGKDGVSSRVTAATVELQGFPIRSLSWSLLRGTTPEENKYQIELKGRQSFTFSKEYLKESFAFIVDGFNKLVGASAYVEQ